MAELLTFSRLAAAREAAPPGDVSRLSPLRALQQLPDEAADMLMGRSDSVADQMRKPQHLPL